MHITLMVIGLGYEYLEEIEQKAYYGLKHLMMFIV